MNKLFSCKYPSEFYYLIALASTLALSACANTPQQRIYQGYGIVAASTQIVTGALQNGQIKTHDAETFSTIAKIAVSALDGAQLAVMNKNAPQAIQLLDQAEKAIRDFQQSLTLAGITK